MAISYRSIEKTRPGTAGGGTRKFYAQRVNSGEADLEEITEYIEKSSTVSGADIRAVLYALVDAVPKHLGDGRIVRLGELGSLRVNLRAEGCDTREEVNAASIKGGKIIFSPGRRLKKMLKNLEYVKDNKSRL